MPLYTGYVNGTDRKAKRKGLILNLSLREKLGRGPNIYKDVHVWKEKPFNNESLISHKAVLV